ncbi:Protein VPRBP [Operophtera brumata]|uniref:Protein VPRBP n=1 Tax=Operophtera brumata TaxID=104452 RepID=A0A0L7K571_OPEBR|nr:Protein VPRBP [Operophtera brumata]
MFFGLSFQFRVILEEFDNQAHLRLRAAQVSRQHGDNVPEPPPYKASKSSSEEIQEQIELLQSVAWSRWAPVDELVELGGIALLLQVVGLAYEWNFNGRWSGWPTSGTSMEGGIALLLQVVGLAYEWNFNGRYSHLYRYKNKLSYCKAWLRSALDVISVCCVAPRVQMLLTDKVDMRDADPTTGVNIVLGAADGEIVSEPEVQKAALNVLVNCVCAPKYALELLERVSGKSKHKGAEFESSLANIHRVFQSTSLESTN